MARIGFTKSYAPGTFGVASIPELFGLMKAAFIDAGFVVVADTATNFEFLPIGVPLDAADDDTPHWGLRYEDHGSYATLYGVVYQGQSGGQMMDSNNYWLVDSYAVTNIPEIFTFWFAADGLEGWWWLHSAITDASSPSGMSFRAGVVATRSRRYAADRYSGLCARCGLRDLWGSFYVPYALDPGGNRSPQSMPSWSPLGGNQPVGKRHPDSPLPRMAVPVFPAPGSWMTACVMGELDHVLNLTSGYTHLEEAVPGWIAFVGGEWDQSYAVPAPVSFEVK